MILYRFSALKRHYSIWPWKSDGTSNVYGMPALKDRVNPNSFFKPFALLWAMKLLFAWNFTLDIKEINTVTIEGMQTLIKFTWCNWCLSVAISTILSAGFQLGIGISLFIFITNISCTKIDRSCYAPFDITTVRHYIAQEAHILQRHRWGFLPATSVI